MTSRASIGKPSSFLAGIFVIVGSLTKVGIIDDLASFFIRFVGDNRLVAYLTIV
jgi:Na+/H+ antiporter NhaD/arsenite permease-like protein